MNLDITEATAGALLFRGRVGLLVDDTFALLNRDDLSGFNLGEGLGFAAEVADCEVCGGGLAQAEVQAQVAL